VDGDEKGMGKRDYKNSRRSIEVTPEDILGTGAIRKSLNHHEGGVDMKTYFIPDFIYFHFLDIYFPKC